MSISRKITEGAGSGGGSGETYVDDVFSTDVFDTELEVSNTITNGIDLAGEGGMIWLKTRDTPGDSTLHDSERGLEYGIYTTGTDPHYDFVDLGFTKPIFSSDGYTTSTARVYSKDGEAVGWTFRKAPSFFDVVTYTGQDGHTQPHNLGAVPGMIIVKCTSSAQSPGWIVWHRDTGDTGYLVLNGNAALDTSSSASIISNVTDTSFDLADWAPVSNVGKEYVAYVFAHDDDSDEGMIQCGSYTGDRNNGVEIDLGWEPQWILIKCTSSGGDAFQWLMLDTMRGLTESDSQYLYANGSDAELAAGIPLAVPTATGFKLPAGTGWNTNNETGEEYIYMAIRRPNKPAEEFDPDELFAVAYGDGTRDPAYKGPLTDFRLSKDITSSSGPFAGSRLQGTKYLKTAESEAESDASYSKYDFMNGWCDLPVTSPNTSWMWRRAPGFFDVVTYEGNGVAGREVPHSLGVAPEMMWVKCRGDRPWRVYCESLGSRAILTLNANDKVFTTANEWNNKNPTDTVFTLDGSYTVNGPSNDYIAYLWASVPGICDIGSYTGTGDAQWIDCGFGASAPRFVLIKSTSVAGDWYYWDSLRGLVSGNSPYLLLNNTDAQVTNTNWISPSDGKGKTGGFLLNSSSSSQIYKDGVEYIYMAIA
jgi:hypothetical protein